MAEVYTISGADEPRYAPCPAGWQVTPNGNCGAPGGGRAPAAIALQNALRALGAVVGDPVLKAVAADGYIGPTTTAAVNRAFTSHVGSGQATARYRTGGLTQVQVANEAAALAMVITAEIQRRGAPAPAPPTSLAPAAPQQKFVAEIGPAVLEPSGPPVALWALVGLLGLGIAGGAYVAWKG
jgi:peptidoglycan hydrolase-like protein with peptidoglycan-binding domain